MTPVLVLTHGEFGPVLLRAAEGMFGPQADAAALGLGADETPESFAARVAAARAALGAPPLVLVDLAGGTPWNVSLASGCAAPPGDVVAGLSLPLLLEALSGRGDQAPRDLAASLVRLGPGTIVRAAPLLEAPGRG